MVVGHGQRHQLVEADFIGPVVGHQALRDVGQLQTALQHHQRRDPEIRRNVLDGPPSATSAAKASNWSAGCMASRCGSRSGSRCGLDTSSTRRQGTFQSLARRRFFASSRRTARRRPRHDFVMHTVSSQSDGEVLQQVPHARMLAAKASMDGPAVLRTLRRDGAQAGQRHQQCVPRGCCGDDGDRVDGPDFGWVIALAVRLLGVNQESKKGK